MPVPKEHTDEVACGSSKKRNGVEKKKATKQATIGNLFKKSNKRKSLTKEDSANKAEQDTKKQKLQDEEETAKPDSPETSIGTLEKKIRKVVERCKQCHQVIQEDQIKMFEGDPPDAVEEFVMLVDPKLSLLSGNEEQFDNLEDRPQHKLTEFSIYDKYGHLSPFDTGLIDKNIELFFSGYVKPVYDDSPDREGGVCTKRMGPINEWWTAGFDGGENALIGFGTAFAEYVLMQPSEDYAPIMNAVSEKICMSKIVIEFILTNPEASYEELLNKIETTVPPENCSKLTEDSLLRHAQFLVEQVESFDSAAAEDEEAPPLIASTCMRDLIKLAGVTLGKRRELRGVKVKAEKKALGPTLATTTPLVSYVFDTFFKDQIDLKATNIKRKRRCGVCEVCQQPDCGQCRACKDMVKFGGTGRAKQCCINRRCPNLAVQEAEENAESQDEDAESLVLDRSPKMSRRGSEKIVKTKVKWAAEPYMEKKKKKLYKSVIINGIQIGVGDYVKVCPDNPSDPLYICRVAYMWEDFNGKKMFHAQWLYRSAETVLGETGDPTEIFLCDDCDASPLGSIMSKCKVRWREFSSEWCMDGGKEDPNNCEITEDDQEELVLQKWYDIEEGCFLDPPKEFLKQSFAEDRYCACCDRESKKQKMNIPQGVDEVEDETDSGDVSYKKVLFKGEELLVGDCVYVHPEAYKYKKKPKVEHKQRKVEATYDEEKYPELYRKSNDYIKGSNLNIVEPYRIGCILRITQSKGKFGDNKDILLRLRKFYRPENTHKGFLGTTIADINMLYWCEEEATVGFEDVEGKCYVTYVDDPDISVTEFMKEGPDRFYFKEAYDPDTEKFDLPPNKARNELAAGKGKKGKGKGKAKKGSVFQQNALTTDHPVYEQVEKLRALDIFAGCGGLSEGLHEVGVADSRWAIEFEPSAAQAYRLNNPGCIVFNADCNHILRLIMEGKDTDESGQRLPRKGEVDLLCGGPPCQGFSGMNRFNHREYSMFKNSLVVSYLGYCDYFRPRFFILENVRNFVSFKKSLVLKLIMKCLIKMGYQCEFGVLQAGSYGIPQTRRRAILIAAAPGETLPKYPEPLHVFSAKGLSLSVMIDDKKYQALKRLESAPYRTITVRDAMSDLPTIKNGANKLEIAYDSEPISHFQKMVRGKHVQQVLRDHICKDMSPLVESRMRYIPTKPGSDWRDLPNIITKLRDGTSTKKLLYLHEDKKQGPNSNGEPRGVCACASGDKCDPTDRQFGTLIPWCLPHTSNRHNHWSGLYGRIEWDGFFSTTVTNPEPMGKQGRVLHPEQHRVVSVRECARSQGFPDTFRFYGNILDKHRQIGNAVAPPMAAAIGQEIRKALVLKSRKDVTDTVQNETQTIPSVTMKEIPTMPSDKVDDKPTIQKDTMAEKATIIDDGKLPKKVNITDEATSENKIDEEKNIVKESMSDGGMHVNVVDECVISNSVQEEMPASENDVDEGPMSQNVKNEKVLVSENGVDENAENENDEKILASENEVDKRSVRESVQDEEMPSSDNGVGEGTLNEKKEGDKILIAENGFEESAVNESMHDEKMLADENVVGESVVDESVHDEKLFANENGVDKSSMSESVQDEEMPSSVNGVDEGTLNENIQCDKILAAENGFDESAVNESIHDEKMLADENVLEESVANESVHDEKLLANENGVDKSSMSESMQDEEMPTGEIGVDEGEKSENIAVEKMLADENVEKSAVDERKHHEKILANENELDKTSMSESMQDEEMPTGEIGVDEKPCSDRNMENVTD